MRGHAPSRALSLDKKAPVVVVVNEAMARRFWPGSDPIGQIIELAPRGPSAEIVGLAVAFRMRALGEAPAPFLYASSASLPLTASILHARLRPGARAVPHLLQRAVSDVAPGVVIESQTTFSELRAVPLFPQRALAWVTGLFGALTMFLTGVGLFGVVAYAVNLRKIDVGIRVALGATPGDVLRSTMAREMPWLTAGLLVGLAGARFGGEAVRRAIDGIAGFETATVVEVTALVIALVLFAVWLPSRHALRIEPARALRGD